MPSFESLFATTKLLLAHQLINPCEQARVQALLAEDFPFCDAMSHCDSIHLHVKVCNANDEQLSQVMSESGELDYSKPGFVKYRFAGCVNLIFSSIPVSEDELVENSEHNRKRPFLDHIGIDLRREEPQVSQAFAGIPAQARSLGWAVASQGCNGKGVHCCHVEVNAKHWVYPSESSPAPQIPLEFAFGELKINVISGGCDLRPMDPVRKQRDGVTIPNCRD